MFFRFPTLYFPISVTHGTKHLKLLVIKCVQITVCCNIFCADVMVGMGYNLEEIQDSLAKMKYDEITATYLLLGRKASEVRTSACYHLSTSQWIRSSLLKLSAFTNGGDDGEEKESLCYVGHPALFSRC